MKKFLDGREGCLLMSDYIFDGEIHPLSEDYAYITKKIDKTKNFEDWSDLSDLQYDFIEKYVEYLIEYNKERIKEILTTRFMPDIKGRSYDEDCTFIYQPNFPMDSLSHKGTLSLKFKRSSKDNL